MSSLFLEIRDYLDIGRSQETLLVLYPGMEHHLSDPKMQLDAMERNLTWFKEHLLNMQ